MTVGAQVKSCYSSIKNAESTLVGLKSKTQNPEAGQAFTEAQKIITGIKEDVRNQVIHLTKEEPQYKN